MMFLQKVAGLLMFAMTIVVLTQLVSRNFLKVPVIWTEDVAKLLLVWMTFIGSPVVLHKGEHLMVDLIYAQASPKGKKYIRLLSCVVVVIFCVIAVKIGIDVCTNKVILRSSTAAAKIPRVFIYGALPVGALLMGLVALNSLIDTILILLGKKEDTIEEIIIDETKTLDELEGRINS